MSNELLKLAVKAAIKIIPKLADKLSTTQHLVEDLSAAELARVFLSNPCNPKCFVTSTTCSPDEVSQICLRFFDSIKAKVSAQETKDKWQVLAAIKEAPTWFGTGIYSHEHIMLVAISKTDDTTSVIIGCRFITQYKTDPFKNYAKASFERVREIAHLIQPNSGMRDLAG